MPRLIEKLQQLDQRVGKPVHAFATGTGRGLIELLAGDAHASVSSTTLEQTIKAARALDGNILIPDNLQYHAFDQDQIVIIAHKSNPMTTISPEQLAKIYSGETTNWLSLNGKNEPIHPFLSRRGSGTNQSFIQHVMKDTPIGSSAIYLLDNRAVILGTPARENTIGFVSLTFHQHFSGHSRILKGTNFHRSLGIITIGPPSPALSKIIELLRSPATKKQLNSTDHH